MKPAPKTWRELIERVTFKFPLRVTLKAEIDESRDDERVVVVLHVPDMHTGEPSKVYNADNPPAFDERMTAAHALWLLRAQILRVLEHEVDEHLQFDGVQIRNPHEDPKERALRAYERMKGTRQ